MSGDTSNMKEKKAILFDSGRVLNQPATGHWFITPYFFKYVDKKKFNGLSHKKRKLAFNQASKYINSKSFIIDEEEEYICFLEYYRILAQNLPELGLGDDQIQAITKDYVYNYSKYRFFEDVQKIIPRLSQSYKLAIVSDAWPSLENVFKKAELRQYFSVFVISSQIGVTKPHESMYQTALKGLDMLPEEVIFIDDSIRNCKGANKLGIDSILLCREWKLYMYSKLKGERKIARNLKDIERRLQ